MGLGGTGLYLFVDDHDCLFINVNICIRRVGLLGH